MHAAGVAADARTFEHLDPAAVGNERDILASELSGKATIRSQAERAGLELDDAGATARGRAAEGARARAATTTRRRRPPSSCCCGARPAATSRCSSSRASASSPRSGPGARSRPRRRSRSRSTASATSASPRATARSTPSTQALRGAIADRYPHLAEIELTNYKVRILDEYHGTGAVTRVLLDSADGEREWGTIGVSENIIEASWEALVDSLEYAFQPRADASCLRPGADPARPAGDRRPRGGAGARGAALGPALAGADGRALRARARRVARGRGRGRGLQRHDRPAPRGAGARLGRGRRGPDQPLQLRRLGQLPALRGGARRSSATSTR